jgi:ABC-2 type transport system permease protein
MIHDVAAVPTAPPVYSDTKPLYWAIRRELWENRSVYLAPLIVTAVVLFAMILSVGMLPRRIRAAGGADPVQQHRIVAKPFSLAPAPIMLVSFIVGAFYALDALHGERRDRSILFWKSLPVSDTMTVLSKASIPMVVMPALAFVLSVITFYALLFLGTLIFAGSGLGALRLWSEVRFIEEPLVMIYGLVVHSLWFAPIYAFFLLVSAWARRTPILWIVVPLFLAGALERMLFNSKLVMSLLRYRVIGAMGLAFETGGRNVEHVWQLTPLRFLTSPGLWAGLVFAALCLALAIRLRRDREPI